MRNTLKKRKILGFTLIEMLVVMAVVGILVSIVLVSLGNSRERALKADAHQTMRNILLASEFVFANFEYYPNDSHNGGITCPKDIEIEPSGDTFGTYINVCNDPWGNPYEWNNHCEDGTLRKADGSEASCPPFSDANAGPIGIASGGPDGNFENCTNDDICNGKRGHAVHNWPGQDDTPGGDPPPPDPTCGGSPSACSLHGTQPLCGNAGCTWQTEQCSGGGVCNGLGQGLCNSTPTCTWNPASCGGTPDPCPSHSDENSCTNAGCDWD